MQKVVGICENYFERLSCLITQLRINLSLGFKIFICFYFFCMSVMHACMYIYLSINALKSCSAQGGGRVTDPLELELHMIVSCRVCWDSNPAFCKNSQCS